jgi:hypothetical protein
VHAHTDLWSVGRYVTQRRQPRWHRCTVVDRQPSPLTRRSAAAQTTEATRPQACPIAYCTDAVAGQVQSKEIIRDRTMPDAVVDVAGKDISEADAADAAEEKVGLFAKFRRTKKDEKETSDDTAVGEKALPPVPFLKLFRFTTRTEKVMMVSGAVCAFLHGSLLPLFTIVFGSVLETFSKPSPNGSELVSEIGGVAKVCLFRSDEAVVSPSQPRQQTQSPLHLVSI